MNKVDLVIGWKVKGLLKKSSKMLSYHTTTFRTKVSKKIKKEIAKVNSTDTKRVCHNYLSISSQRKSTKNNSISILAISTLKSQIQMLSFAHPKAKTLQKLKRLSHLLILITNTTVLSSKKIILNQSHQEKMTVYTI